MIKASAAQTMLTRNKRAHELTAGRLALEARDLRAEADAHGDPRKQLELRTRARHLDQQAGLNLDKAEAIGRTIVGLK